jgi:hypothetical protein
MMTFRAWASTAVLLLVNVGEARDPNLQTDDPNGSGHDYDSHGAYFVRLFFALVSGQLQK